jgi:phospholipid/cholesterol/gamma-HCH transport system ATP-binding protein
MNTIRPEIKICLRNLSKSFGNKIVLDNINLTIQKGESIAIIGGSGTGKSVLLKSIIGLVKPDSGSLRIDGKETSMLTHKERMLFNTRFGVLFQGGALFDSLTIWENIAFGLMQEKKLNKKNAKEKAIQIMSEVELDASVSNSYPSELSGGMQKRVALARAIATEPEILIFDEPTTGLDPVTSNVINDLIIKSVNVLGATAISVSHDIASVKKIADNVVLLHEGHFVWQGPADKIEKSQNDYVRNFVNGVSNNQSLPSGRS